MDSETNADYFTYTNQLNQSTRLTVNRFSLFPYYRLEQTRQIWGIW